MTILRRNFLRTMAAAGGASLLRSGHASAQETGVRPEDYPRPDLRQRAIPARFTYSRPVIDAHTHYFTPEFIDLVVKEGEKHGAEITGPNKTGHYGIAAWGGGYYPYPPEVLGDALSNLDTQIKGMDERGGVSMHVMGMTAPKVYWTDPEFGLRLSEAQNNGLSKIAQAHPKRFMGQIMLPLQSPSLALKELERASKLPGLRGINMGEHINGTNPSDKRFWPLWERCAQLGHPLMLHNIDPMGADRLYQGGLNMMNLLGNPIEATVAPMAFLLSGALDEFPNLEIFLPHAGGAFPWIAPRANYTMSRGGEAFKGLKHRRATDYFPRFHFDLILHSPRQMRMLIDLVGIQNVTCGTDWPQASAIWRPVEYVESIPGITQKEAEQILCVNPARLLKLNS